MRNGSSHDDLARLLSEAGQKALVLNPDAGEELVRQCWPHQKGIRTRRSISERQKLLVFMADGFRCRYTGDLLFFSGYLWAISALWPDTFPAHPHGKSDEAHEAFWTHFASVEHLDPIATGGTETEDNWILRAWPGTKYAVATVLKRSDGKCSRERRCVSGTAG